MIPNSAQPPPTKANLKAWWNHFTSAQKAKKDVEEQRADEWGPSHGTHSVFGKPLRESLRHASVQISTANANGDLFVWGYIPVVVAKCGLYLKENATEVGGTFRVNGSNKRMRDLQALFDTPPRYGKGLDWDKETFTTHDVASVFRRYLTQMPEPIIPHDMYHDFRDALAKQPRNTEEVVTTYKRLIGTMPRANQYLLLYVLDLLSVFARKSDKNLMTATNLAVIFRPGLISHPNHEMSPKEHQLSQEVLEFLIAQQDWFLLDIPPPPQSEPGSPTSLAGVDDDIAMVPSSDDNDSQAASGGWKLVGREKRNPQRRRTTADTIDNDIPGSELSPVAEMSSPPSPPGSVTRSRTLPSGTNRGGRPEGQERARVLRKQKRATSSQSRRSEMLVPEPT